MSDKAQRLKPRKKPVQARSAFTVNAIFEGCIQVLLAEGPERLTTTKVAERAGVSVGTLYQYFGDKQSLLAGVLEHHLIEIVEKVEQACSESQGQDLETVVRNLVTAFFDAKLGQPDVSRALYAVSAELEGNALVMRYSQRTQTSIVAVLQSIPNVGVTDLVTSSFLLTTMLIGPAQALLSVNAPEVFMEKVKEETVAMLVSYLRG
ncbi:MAG: TetR/AcrR family transcriptional regulator [Pseudomonadales bacterium]|nr:TetR/AcrR family transcriptional regulator [Pseudomonadales bacterium]